MKVAVIYKLICIAYAQILRDLLIRAVDDPDQEWDETVLKMLDGLFNYEEE